MTEKQRMLTVLNKEQPDRVPWFPDLGHWYQAESGAIWNLFQPNDDLSGLLKLHHEVQGGWYIGALPLHSESYTNGVERVCEIDGTRAVETYKTELGSLTMVRRWNQTSFSWDIEKHLVETADDLKILTLAIQSKQFSPLYDNWAQNELLAGEMGLPFPSLAYTGLGSLISYYMGIEDTVYALMDEPELTEKYIETYNKKHLELVELYSDSPAPHMIFTDNLSSDVQSPTYFLKYSFNHYKQLADLLHAKGKTVSAHIDGRMRGLLELLARAGIDVADACTPKPNGDLTPAQIRQEAGPDLILMGGVSPGMWLPDTPEKVFIEHVRAWLDLRKTSPLLVQSAGDQVPPGTKLQRIKLMAELIDTYGRY